MAYIKTIDELIEELKKIREKEGNIVVCHSEKHEYWGSVESYLSTNYNLVINEHALPDGPKSGKSVKALQFGS